MHDPRVLIVGGASLAPRLEGLYLSRGVSAEIVERATAFPVAGAGLYLPGNGVRAIAALGLADPFSNRPPTRVGVWPLYHTTFRSDASA